MEILKDIFNVIGVLAVILMVFSIISDISFNRWEKKERKRRARDEEHRKKREKEEEDEKERIKNPSSAEWIERERLVDENVRSLRKDDDFLRELDLRETATFLSDFIEEFYEGKDDFVKEKLCITSRDLLKIKIASVEGFDGAVLKRFYHVLAKCADLPKEYNKLF